MNAIFVGDAPVRSNPFNAPFLSGRSGYDEVGSDSEGASVGAPTRAHHVNGPPADAFDMNAFAQALSHFTSQHMPAANVTEGNFRLRQSQCLTSPNGLLNLSPSIRSSAVL